MINNDEYLPHILALGQAGRFIFPVGRDKKPLVSGWPEVGTTDEAQLRAWFDKGNAPNPAVITGHKSGFFCLDVDGEEGKASLDELESNNGPLPYDCVARTPSGGLHLYFEMPEFDLRNSASKLAPKLDIRANGGYVLVPPGQALNRAGQIGFYSYVTETTLVQGILPQAPPWLLALLKEPNFTPPSNKRPQAGSSPYGRKVLAAECDLVAAAPEGRRNETLNKAAFTVYQLVCGRELEAGEAEARLISAAETAGLSMTEIRATIQSARRSASLNPRRAPGLPEPVSLFSKADLVPPDIGQLPQPPIAVLPPAIQTMLLEAVRVFGDLPLEVPVTSFFGLLSGCVGQSLVVEIKQGWQVAGNFYWAIVAPSGLGKSPCSSAMMQPLWAQDKKCKDKWDCEMAAYNQQMEERRQCKDKDSLGPIPSVPLLTQYIVDDATIEAIGSILADNPRGLLWCCDELAMLIQNLDRYSNARGGSKGRLLSSYDRAPWKTSRRERDKDQVVMSAVLSIFGTIQPKILRAVFSQNDADSGLLPRFAFILARRKNPPLMSNETFSGQSLLKEIADHLLSWTMLENCGQPVPRSIALSAEAYLLYENWSHKLAKSTWNVSEIDRIIVPKVTGMVARLALLLHALESALEKIAPRPQISLTTMAGAAKFGDWLYQHQKHIWSALGLESEAIKTPLDEAVMQAGLALAEYLKDNQWRVLNDDFNPLVRSYLSQTKGRNNGKVISPELNSDGVKPASGQDLAGNQIGRSANRLGVKSITIGKKRGKEFSPELIEKFRAAFFL